MRILIADDSQVSRRLLEAHLQRWGHEVQVAADGNAAWKAMQQEDAPALAILDWMMPGLDGVEICRRARARAPAHPLYIIVLTARTAPEDVVQALDAGANDYVTKPFRAAELQARLGVGIRVVLLQREVAGRVAELEEALAHVEELHGILPICSYCKRVRSDADSWHGIEEYVSAHSAARFSHGVCPQCVEKVLKPQIEELRRNRAEAALPEAQGMKVLLADDDRVLVHLFTARLRALGWQVEAAHDAMQTLMYAINSQPDVIALDIGMPGGNGFGVLTKLKQSVRTEAIPVVVMSNSVVPEDEAKVLALGAMAFFRKPVDPETLHFALLRLVATKAVAEPLSQT
jgi:DNA-binding response OmpR family regulator